MIGILSFVFDLLFFNIFNYSQNNALIFPMFTITYVLSSLYFRIDIGYIIVSLLLYISLIGIIYYPFFFLLLSYYIIRFNNKSFNIRDYLFKLLILLVSYDFFLFLFTNSFVLSKYSIDCFFYKLFISIPFNLLYAFILYYLNKVLKKKKISIN